MLLTVPNIIFKLFLQQSIGSYNPFRRQEVVSDVSFKGKNCYFGAFAMYQRGKHLNIVHCPYLSGENSQA